MAEGDQVGDMDIVLDVVDEFDCQDVVTAGDVFLVELYYWAGDVKSPSLCTCIEYGKLLVNLPLA